jgi:TonB-linked SusC/RagA family outer membrane protein
MLLMLQLSQQNSGFSLAPENWRTAATSLILVLGVAFFGVTAHGQDQHTVSGTVMDAEAGSPLPGVNIRVVGTDIGTVTSADGTYELSVPSPDETLRFSFVGYETRTLEIDGRTTIDVSMQPATLTGTEVVVTGYSEQRREDLTGAVDIANVENMQSIGSELVTEMMQGQVAGVSINTSGQPGDEPQINIRGFNTFGNNQPLFIVDGVPTQDISFLNPQDISSFQVLKDAGAASVYGARASNGVVVITTNKGRGDEISVNYSGSFGYQVPQTGEVYNILTPMEQARLERMADQNTEGIPVSHPTYLDSDGNPSVPEWILPARADNPNTDQYFVNPVYKDANQLSRFRQFVRANQGGTNWFDALTEPAAQTQHSVSIGGGGDIGNYYASLGYTNQDGAVQNTHLERYNVRANTEFNVSDNVRIGENLSFTVSENLKAGTLSGRNALGFAYSLHSIIPVQDIRGNFAGTQAPGLGSAQNVVALRHRTRNDDQQTRRVFGNVFAEIDLTSGLTFETDFGADLQSGFLETFDFPTYEQAQNNSTNAFTRQTRSVQNWKWSNELSYEGSFGKHDVSAVAAVETIRNISELNQVTRTDYFSFSEDFVQLGTGSGAPTVEQSTRTVSALLSLIGNVDYNYDNTYLLGLTVRRDGSSKLINDQWGTFPAITAGVRLSELFLQDVSWLTDLKIRGGYGVMGNQLNVDPNNGFTLFGGSPTDSFYPINGQTNSTEQGIRRTRIGNPDAQWERNEDINIGMDFAVLDGQLEGSVDLYQKDVEDLLFAPALPGTAGAAQPPARNVASMRNRGLEVSLRGETSITNELDVDGQINFTTYNNEITSIAQGIGKFDVGVVRNEVGFPISSFFGYKVEGFWQSEEEIQQANEQAPDGEYMAGMGVGRFRYKDTNGDGQITADDRTHLGNPHPDFSYGLNLNVSYRNFDITAFLYGEQGRELWNSTRRGMDFRATFNTANSERALYDSWTPENRNATAPIQEQNSYFSTSGANSSYFVEDASYLRLKNLRIGYRIPSSLLQGIGGTGAKLYVQANNLFTITPYSGLDPDIGATESAVNAAEGTGGRVQTGATNFGVDRGGFPAMRTYRVGINLSF